MENFSDASYFVNDFINLSLTWNTGIGFGLLSFNNSFVYNLITTLIGIVIIILIYIALRSDIFEKIIYSVIIGGAIGNIYDRFIYNAVPDFVDLHYNNFHWFTFNVADIFITIGIIGMLTKEFLKKNLMSKLKLLLPFYIFITSCGALSDAGKVLRNEKVQTTDEFLVEKEILLLYRPILRKFLSLDLSQKKR